MAKKNTSSDGLGAEEVEQLDASELINSDLEEWDTSILEER
jgi:hypothetical protein